MPRACPVESHVRRYQVPRSLYFRRAARARSVVGYFCSSERETPPEDKPVASL
jgi:hypothetical protein